MNSKIKFYNEKHLYENKDIPNLDELIDRKVCENKGKYVVYTKTGIVSLNGSIYIIFPFGYKVSEPIDDIQLLLDVFDKIIFLKMMDAEYYDRIDIDNEGDGHLLPIAHELIKDYRDNGIIVIENIRQGINIGGKINWKNTMKLKTQVLTDEGMPIFTRLIMSHKENDKDAMLRSLHMYVINKSIAMFGVLWGISSVYISEDDIRLPVDKCYAIKFLKAERHVTYNTRLLKVIDLIIKFIESEEKEGQDDRFMSLSTKSFYTVWELMCKYVLQDEYKILQDQIPKPYWRIGNMAPKYTDQIPDIIYIQNRKLFIVDAKYYNVNKNRPGWHDLVKQYFYALSLEEVLTDIEEIKNIMIMPGEIPEVAKRWGVSKVEGVPKFGEVHGIFLNMNEVMKNYCYGIAENYRDEVAKVLLVNKN